MPGSYTPLNEWCDENAHRQFPLIDSASGKDTTGTMVLPQPFLVDAIVAIPVGRNIAAVYIKSIITRRLYVDVELGYDDGSVDFSFAWVRGIPHNASRNSSYVVEPTTQTDGTLKDFEIAGGALVIGDMAQVLDQPGNWLFTLATANLIESRVMTGVACVQSMQVASDVLTGQLTLRAGDNVSISTRLNTTLGVTEIVVSASTGTSGAGFVLDSDDAILAALTSLYGDPIVSINGQGPDGSGNFQIGGEDCTNVATSGASISISNPCASPCCDKSMLQDVYGTLSQLNLRYAVLESYYQSIGLTLNEMQARMLGFEV